MRLFRSFGICMAFLILISSCAGPKLKKSESVIFCVEVAGVSYFADENGVMLFGRQFDDAYPFRERLASVVSNDKWGFIDTKGEMVIIPCAYDLARSFSKGFTGVVSNGKLGVINQSGEFVIPPIADWIWW